MFRIAFALLALVVAFPAAAQSWPSRPVRFIVGFPPGGGADLLIRMLMPSLNQTLGQPIVVDNRPGANGRIGAELVARAAPDGYTFLMSPEGALVISPFIAKQMSYDPLSDFAPVSQGTRTATLLVASPNSPYRTLADVIAAAKKNPGKLNYGSSGIGGPNHLVGEAFKVMAGIEIEHVAYRGTGAVIPATMSGEVPLMFGALPGLAGFAKSGELRPIALSTPERSPALPDVPTIAEAGVPGFAMTTWFGALAPKDTPPAIVDAMRAAIVTALNDPQIRTALLKDGAEPVGSTPAEFQAFIAAEHAKYGALIKRLNITE